MIPVEVRMMLDEFKADISAYINHTIEKITQIDLIEKSVLQTYKLPEAINALTAKGIRSALYQ